MLTIAKFDRYDLVNTPGGDKPGFTIWFSGCSQRCPGCYNQRLWDRSAGKEHNVGTIMFLIDNQREKTGIDDIVLLGGEPMEQDISDITALVTRLDKSGYKVWMYTSWDMNDIPESIKSHLYTIKCGRYDETLKCDGIPSSSNQKFYRKSPTGEWNEISFKEEIKQ